MDEQYYCLTLDDYSAPSFTSFGKAYYGSRYEDDYANFGVVREIIPLPESDYLLGIAQVFETLEDLKEDHAHIDYFRLSEIRLAYYPNEQEDFANAE